MEARNRNRFQPGDRIGQYELIRLLGSGASGVVWLATHQFLQDQVALKCMHAFHVGRDALQRRMRAEAMVLSRIRHANIVAVRDAGITDEGVVWIAMDYLEGQTLREILMAEGRQTIPRALYIAGQIADGVQAAHDFDVVHRDLKPENVIVTSKDEVKVLDLGTAKLSRFDVKTTEPNKIPGTVAYMSKEHLLGHQVDGRTDVYALGLILYEMLAGFHPFARGGFEFMPPAQILALHQIETPPPPLPEVVPGIPEELWRFVERCLRKDRDQRPASMPEVSAELRRQRNLIVDYAKRKRAERASLGNTPPSMPRGNNAVGVDGSVTQPMLLATPSPASTGPANATASEAPARPIEVASSTSRGETPAPTSSTNPVGVSKQRTSAHWVFAGIGIAAFVAAIVLVWARPAVSPEGLVEQTASLEAKAAAPAAPVSPSAPESSASAAPIPELTPEELEELERELGLKPAASVSPPSATLAPASSPKPVARPAASSVAKPKSGSPGKPPAWENWD